MLKDKYNFKEVEQGKYDFWLENKYFESGSDLSKEPFTVVIPPPNVTGKLHLGHAWDTTLQDIAIRYKRMDGFDALWVPGMDHAGIATQAKIDEKLKQSGIKPRDMRKEDWLKQAWLWKKDYAKQIRMQWAKMGLSLDYTKERFTLDEGLSEAVNKVFIDLYNKGLIYRGKRIIQFDPEAKTALSNIEVIYRESEGALYYVKYLMPYTDKYIEVATTRPETILGDTAVAVNPKDERFKDLVGKEVIVPLVNRRVKIIADNYVDLEYGTGAVKITPAHDPNDYEVGVRHNLEMIEIMNLDATLNENAGKYEGMDRFKAREEIIKDLEKDNLLTKVEKITHSVGYSERTNVMVEPLLSLQWFVKMQPLAKKTLENQKDKDTKVNFVPPRYEKIFTNWMENIEDWCISRQLWWGHKIPAWYKDDELKVQIDSPGEGWKQDSDVLDTWFSSALWPFSTLGWPNDVDTRYYPTSLLVTGYDIIPFWVSRMIFQGLEFTNSRPFKEVLIHGLIRDNEGRKMSKSLGNGVDPMDVIDEYGTDALRYFLTTNTALGMDLRYDDEKVKSSWNFINKLWNASRYVLMNLADFKEENYTLNNLTLEDKWILTKLNETIKEVRKNMESYDYHYVGNTLYNFIWHDFCDWYIELAKRDMNNTTKSVLLTVLRSSIKMLHPFMPYVTEEIYLNLPMIKSSSITISEYPKYDEQQMFILEKNNMENIQKDIVNIRNLKAENNLKKDTKFSYEIKDNSEIYIFMLKLNDEYLLKEDSLDQVINYTSDNININYYYEGEELNKDNLLVEISKLEEQILRREKLLSNQNYLNNAPSDIVKSEQYKLSEEKKNLSILKSKL